MVVVFISIILFISLIIDFILIRKILQAITMKNSQKIRSLCNNFLLTLIIGAGSLSINTLLDILQKTHDLSLGLIILKLFGCIGPFVFGGGLAIYMFRKVAANIDKQ